MNHDQEGDFAAYAAARWDALVRSGVVLGCSLEEAHDLAQTTLLRCYVSWPRVRRAENQDAYVYRVLLNCHRDSRRRRWWGERPTEHLPDEAVADETGRVVTADSVSRAIADLPEHSREVVVLRYYANLDEAQIASLLSIARGTVKSRLSRALGQLSNNIHLVEGS